MSKISDDALTWWSMYSSCAELTPIPIRHFGLHVLACFFGGLFFLFIPFVAEWRFAPLARALVYLVGIPVFIFVDFPLMLDSGHHVDLTIYLLLWVFGFFAELVLVSVPELKSWIWRRKNK